ncbi:MAG: LamG domain-containing protein [Fibrobacterales bacterium]
MIRILYLIVVIILIGCTVTSSESGDYITGITITGSGKTSSSLKLASNVISKETKVPLTGVMVYLYPTQSESRPVDSVISNTDARFTFSDVPRGEYVIMAALSDSLGGIHRSITVSSEVQSKDLIEVHLQEYKNTPLTTVDSAITALSYFHIPLKKQGDTYIFPWLEGVTQFAQHYTSGSPNEPTSTSVSYDLPTQSTYLESDISNHSSSSIAVLSSPDGSLELALSSVVQMSSSILYEVSSSENSLLSSSHEVSSSENTLLSSSHEVNDTTLLTYIPFNDNFDNMVPAEAYIHDDSTLTFGAGIDSSGIRILDNHKYATFTSQVRIYNNETFSISFWVNSDTLDTRQDLFTQRYSYDYETVQEYAIRINESNMVEFKVIDDSTNYYSNCISQNPIEENTWYHILATFNGETQNLYIDGIHNTSTPSQGLHLNTITLFGLANIRSLHFFQDTISNFIGTIDEFKYWDRELTESDVLFEFNQINTEKNE